MLYDNEDGKGFFRPPLIESPLFRSWPLLLLSLSKDCTKTKGTCSPNTIYIIYLTLVKANHSYSAIYFIPSVRFPASPHSIH